MGGGRTHTTHTAHSWRMRTMSLFSLNRIYKPNRHTPMPLTQTHTFPFSSLSLPPFSLCLPHQHRHTAETSSVRISSAVKKKERKKRKSEGNWLRWWEVLSAGGSSGRMDRWIEGTFCSSCAGSDSHIVPGEAGCHLWFKGPSVSTDGNRTWPLWRPLHSFLKERQIKHAWDGDRGGPATFFTLSPSLYCFTHSKRKSTSKTASPWYWEGSRLKARLFRNRSSVDVLPMLYHLNKHLSTTQKAKKTPFTLV